MSSRPKKATRKGAHRRLYDANGSLQTETSLGSHECRKETIISAMSARRFLVLLRTELEATQNKDSQLVKVDAPGNYQHEFQTISLRDDTPNADSLQHGRKRQKNLLIRKTTTVLKKNLADRKKTNSFLQSSGNFWNAECKHLKEELSAVLTIGECDRTLHYADKMPSTSTSRTSKSSTNLIKLVDRAKENV